MTLPTVPKKKKTPWPTQKAMTQVYEMNLWGGTSGAYFSGDGSHNPEIVVPYVTAVRAFLSQFQDKLNVCDLGCGDFNIGKQLLGYTQSYIGVDIVAGLIEHNQQKFNETQLSFKCLDIAKDALPIADCMIVRQVLQHLSNTEVQSVLLKLKNYKYIILTEHIPATTFIANKDIISGQGIRLKKQSGLVITEAPFYFTYQEKKELCTVFLSEKKGKIVTMLYKL